MSQHTTHLHPGNTTGRARDLEEAAELAYRAARALTEAAQEEWARKAATEARDAATACQELLAGVPAQQEILRGVVAESAAAAAHWAGEAEDQAAAAEERAAEVYYSPWS